jgi:hypothetical protein
LQIAQVKHKEVSGKKTHERFIQSLGACGIERQIDRQGPRQRDEEAT